MSSNRYVAAAQLFARSPVASINYVSSSVIGQTRPVRLNFGGLRLWVRPGSRDLRVVRSCLLGEFDAACDLAPNRHGLIIDGGGYIGITSILFAKRFPEAKILCIEPNEENWSLAKANCAAWPNIEVVRGALSARGGVVTLRDRGTGHWGFTIVDGGEAGKSWTEIGRVDALSIDGLLEKYGRSGIDLLKLDIEGAECDLLDPRPAWIERCEVIVAELHDRICPTSTRAFINATEGRVDVWARGEKRISVKAGCVRGEAG